MADIARKTRTETGLKPGDITFEALLDRQEPVLLKGFAGDWPLVRAGLRSAGAAMDHIRGFDAGRDVVSYTGEPEIGGRFFYNEGMTALNFRAGRQKLPAFLDAVSAHLDSPASDAPAPTSPFHYCHPRPDYPGERRRRTGMRLRRRCVDRQPGAGYNGTQPQNLDMSLGNPIASLGRFRFSTT